MPIPTPQTVLKYWTDNNLILKLPADITPYDKAALKVTIPPIAPAPTHTVQAPPAPGTTPATAVASVVTPPNQGPGSTGAQHRAMAMGNIGTPSGGGGGSTPPKPQPAPA